MVEGLLAVDVSGVLLSLWNKAGEPDSLFKSGATPFTFYSGTSQSYSPLTLESAFEYTRWTLSRSNVLLRLHQRSATPAFESAFFTSLPFR